MEPAKVAPPPSPFPSPSHSAKVGFPNLPPQCTHLKFSNTRSDSPHQGLSVSPPGKLADSSPQADNSSSLPRRLLESPLLGSPITLIAGRPSELAKVEIHEEVLATRLKRFPAILNEIDELDDDQQHEKGVVHLPALDPDVLYAYTYFLYTPGLSYAHIAAKFPHRTGSHIIAREHYKLLAGAYVFAEKLGDGHTQDTIIAAFIYTSSQPREHGTRYVPGSDIITIVFEGTQEPSALRNWLVDTFASQGNITWKKHIAAPEYPNEFLQKLTEEMMRWRRPIMSLVKKDVNYYVHMRKKEDEIKGGSVPARPTTPRNPTDEDAMETT